MFPKFHEFCLQGGSVMIGSDVFAVDDGGGGVQYILLELPTYGSVTTQAPGHQSIVFTQGNHGFFSVLYLMLNIQCQPVL